MMSSLQRIFPLCFKMMESFANLGNILRGWAIDKVQKSLAKALNRSEKKEEERYTAVSLRKRFRKSTLAFSVSSRAGLNQEQTFCW